MGSNSKMPLPKFALTIFVLAFVMVGISLANGCSGDRESAHMLATPTAASEQARIQKIKDDPHMPQFAKDIAISQIQANGRGK